MSNDETHISWDKTLVFPKKYPLKDGARKISKMLAEVDIFLASLPGLNKEGTDALRLVCDEIVANVLRHVSADKDAVVEIALHVEQEKVVLQIQDNGDKFDYFDQPSPYLGSDLDKRRVGGLGLYLIKQYFPYASCTYSQGWNIAKVVYCLDKSLGGDSSLASQVTPKHL